MEYVVTVDSKYKYWVQADNEDDAKARGYRLHCSTENFKPGVRSAVTDCKEVNIG